MASSENFKTHNLEITNREKIILTGIEKVKNINSNIFVGKVAGYAVTVQGENLELTKLDLDSGEIEICGTINSLRYGGANTNQSLLKRIFK